MRSVWFGTHPEPGKRWRVTLSIVAMGAGFKKATESALSADKTAKTVTVKVKMAFSRNVHECILPPPLLAFLLFHLSVCPRSSLALWHPHS